MKHLAFALLFSLSIILRATTWDEPWMDTVIADADALVKVKIIKSSSEAFEAKTIEQLAGVVRIPDTFSVDGFSLLRIGSTSGHTDEKSLQFNPALSYYLFVKHAADKKTYHLATPTTGWAKITGKDVNATYRHSYHQASVPEDVYALTMRAIFNTIHAIPFDAKPVRTFMTTHLSRPPALLSRAKDEGTAERFFLQHAALETFRYLGTEQELGLIDPFLAADDFHVQISAVRAIGRINSPGTKKRLTDVIVARRHGFAKVVAILELERLDARDTAPRLRAYLEKAEDTEIGFGGNIMDPRVGTRFPSSVKQAITDLLATWQSPTTKTANVH